ncbi:T9SS type A sorting domain-containing protein [Crocinitomix catalasitica]|nr:T9SS type A sorting domain-containing protein [Crocinitomix catalasitica]
MKNYLHKMMLIGVLGIGSTTFGQVWTTISSDASGDAADGTLLDGTILEYSHDEAADSLWFRFTTTGINATQQANLGVNIQVNYPGGGSTFNFWGWDNTDPFNKLVSVWVTGTPPSSYTGTIGIADAVGVGGSNYTNLFSNNIDISVNTSAGTITIGMERDDLIPDAALGTSITVGGAVGSSTVWNDDIYSAATITLNASGSAITETNSEQFSVFPNPAKDFIFVKSVSSSDLSKLIIRDISGKTVLTTFFQTDAIDISSLGSGVYFVEGRDRQGQLLFVSKMIK